MPVKNAGPFLEECLNSIIEQTETDWELIAVNDGSIDDSPTILNRFAERDKRINVLDRNGSGIIDALRTAYANSSGELITRMDADDRMVPQKLQTLKQNLLDVGKGNLATGLVEYFSKNELGDGYRKYEQWLNGLTAEGNNYTEIYKECVIPSPCWMVYREDLDRCGAFELDTYPEDYDLCFRFYAQGLKVIPTTKVLHHWRDHSSRTSRNHPHYADNRFLELKLNWFLKLDHDPQRPLVLWGAGSKGKSLAKLLTENHVPFHWVCNNPKKIGHLIYGVEIRSEQFLSELENPQVIVSVANPQEQAELKDLLGERAYFFC
ncbi:MAG: glycosyltransferase [Flavobacteriales bacterium]|nr:glycosyltransferase [Flavobacteriales bacterium]